jgi:predicted esterase
LLKRNSPVAGGIAAMSVYKPKQLPKPTGAKGRSVYILHSPDDRVCPYWMAKNGLEELTKAKVRTKMVDYAGGHGWRGDIFGNIQDGIKWLEDAPAASDKKK